jgi:alkane 1-monooxygenase
MVPVQYILLFYFLSSLNQEGLTYLDIAGRILTMGISCVVLGINVGHELGHRVKWYEQWMSKALLLSTLYMHFFIEHNRGHHKRVATPEDPASARYGESLYGFWFRSVFYSYISAWKIELFRLNKHGRKWWSPYNQMLHYLLISFGFCFAIYAFFDVYRLFGFIIAATIGFLFLETVNYLEHYGLQRAKLPGGKYEKVQAKHSWNSNHWIGRLFLFELTRHSDHHYKASRKYQVLRHFDDAPQLPFGYPVMIMMSMLPPLWFYVMHGHMRKYGFEASHLKQN